MFLQQSLRQMIDFEEYLPVFLNLKNTSGLVHLNFITALKNVIKFSLKRKRKLALKKCFTIFVFKWNQVIVDIYMGNIRNQ